MWFMDFIHWVEWWTGADNPSGPEYGFWSGFGSDLTEFTAIAGGFGLAYRHLNCRQKGCGRLGIHNLVDPDTGEHIKVCRKHHPHHDDITAEHIANVAHRILQHQRRHEQAPADPPPAT